MGGWWDGRMCALDLETTSADPEEARIVQAAVVFVGDDRATETWTLTADPGVEIPAEAAAIHGVTTARARAEGIAAPEAIRAIWKQLDHMEPHWPLIAFNARYDLTVLNREMSRHGVDPFDGTTAWVVDPLVIDRHLDHYRPGSRKLDAICAHYGAVLDMAHDAAFDAIAAARAAWVICSKADVVRRVRGHDEALELTALRREWDAVRTHLPLLHAAQAVWAAEQARGLEEHFARQGTPETVPTDWPILPVRVEASA